MEMEINEEGKNKKTYLPLAGFPPPFTTNPIAKPITNATTPAIAVVTMSTCTVVLITVVFET
jgi:hypothetical protein